MRTRRHSFHAERDPVRLAASRGAFAFGAAAAAAALASAGLVYWIGVSEDRSLSAGRELAAPPARRIYASPKPDARQVVRAYDQLRDVYADRGMSGVVRFARDCADGLRTDPRVLDFCLAFDIYAASLGGDDADVDLDVRAWQAQARGRDLTLARRALPPDQDAAARLAEVRGLARQASLAATIAPAPNAAQTAAAAAEACRRRVAVAQGVVCASPALRDADHRMRVAYNQALAEGAAPRRLARDQARFRAAVKAASPDRAAIARLYKRRTHALEVLVRRMQISDD
jgi:uncharacterized protein YecT (DUF1311 family)